MIEFRIDLYASAAADYAVESEGSQYELGPRVETEGLDNFTTTIGTRQ